MTTAAQVHSPFLEPELAGELDDMVSISEAAKLAAFLRRDFLTALSYRAAFLSDAGGIVFQALTFSFVAKMINPTVLPTYNGSHAGYMEFVAVGILLSAFIELGLSRVATSIRQEQLMGTLESVLLTPTRIGTIQSGSCLYSLVYIPIRTLALFAIIALTFGLHFSSAGILPAFAVLILFVPFVWGLGIVGAAGMLTFRRSGMGIGLITAVLVLGSGAFFPLTLMPHWIQTLSEGNPIARATESMRQALIGGTTDGISATLAILAIAAVVTFACGLLAFKVALARERRRGTLGVY